MPEARFLGSSQLGRVLGDLRFTCLDVGARGGFTADLLPLAPVVDAIGFEPDPEECSRGPILVRQALLAVRTEVSFLPMYRNQPVFAQVDQHLRGCGFVAMGFVELHDWRRSTRVKHPALARGSIPCSRSQLAHRDVLYFRDPRTMQDPSPAGIQRLLKAAFLACVYENVDHAASILEQPGVGAYLGARYGVEATKALDDVSRTLLKQRRARRRQRAWREAGRVVGLAL